MGDESSTELDLNPVQGRLAGCTFYVAEGVDAGRSWSFRKGVALIGKTAQSLVRLEDDKVSREHAELRLTADGVEIRDLDSKNGTYLGANRVNRATLGIGSHFRVGDTRLAILPLSDGSGIELDDSHQYGELLGRSVAMRRLFAILRRLEHTGAPILLQGETGTGKDLVARTIHAQSERSQGPFMVLDCGALPSNLLASELFGYVKGAFTGADTDREGVIEAAHGGTLFLDEIGELPLDMQPSLLRALEANEIRRVGDTNYRPVDVRIIAATNVDLAEAMAAKSFRQDLFYRLAVLQLRIAPLRERSEDIELLARHFVTVMEQDPDEIVTAENLRMLQGRAWPGNLRELRNVLFQIATLGPNAITSPEPMAEEGSNVDVSKPFHEEREAILGDFEAQYVREALENSNGNIAQAAKAAGVTRNYFKKLMKKHGLRDDDDKSGN